MKNKIYKNKNEIFGWFALGILVISYIFFAFNKLQIFILIDIIATFLLFIYNIKVKSYPNIIVNGFIFLMLIVGYIQQYGVKI